MKAAISRDRRFTRSHPCPVCSGYDAAPRGKGVRCYGYISDDGEYIHCTREEYAGTIRATAAGTFAHRIRGMCACGVMHAPSPLAPLDRASTPLSRKVFVRSDSPGRQLQPSPASMGERRVLWNDPAGSWLYRDASGVPVYKVTRYPIVDTETGERDKTYIPWHPEEKNGRRHWHKGMGDVARIPYRLPELLAADRLAPVYLCEGEKCADTLADAGVVASTTAGGANAWQHSEASMRDALAGRHVVILPDNDAPGEHYAQAAAASLYGTAASVRLVHLPGLDEGGDVADWIGQGHTLYDLQALADASPLWAPAPDRLPDPSPASTRDDPAASPVADAGEGIPIPGTAWQLSPDRLQLQDKHGEAIYPWGAPIVHGRITFPIDAAPRGRVSQYDVEIDGQRERITYDELHSGGAWERWGNLAIAGRGNIAAMAATVEYLTREAPTYAGGRATGWREHNGEHVLTFPDGRMIGAGGMIGDSRVYLDISPKHVEPYPDALAVDASPEAQAAALAFTIELCPDNLTAALVLCGHVRSILYGVLRSDFGVLLRGGSGRGKTGTANVGRNLTGDFTGWPTPAGTVHFGDTTTASEDSISQIKHLPLTVEDLAIRDDMPAHEREERAKTLDMILRSVGNNAPMRERMTRNMERQAPRKIDGVPVVSVERLPGMLASALNRAVLLDVGEGEIQLDVMRRDADRVAAGLRGVGHGLIAYIARLWDSEGDALAGRMDRWRSQTAGRLERDILAARNGRPIPNNAIRLPSNGAHLLLAAQVLADYCEASGIVPAITPDRLYGALVRHLCAQVDTIGSLETGGNDGTPLDIWTADHIREALSRGEAHIKYQDERPAIDGALYPAEYLGYRANASGEYVQSGAYVGVVTNDGTALAFDIGQLYPILRKAARQDGRAWDISVSRLAHALVSCGLALPGEGRNMERQIRIGKDSRKTRRLYIPAHLILPESYDGTGNDPDGEGECSPIVCPDATPAAAEALPDPAVSPAAALAPDRLPEDAPEVPAGMMERTYCDACGAYDPCPLDSLTCRYCGAAAAVIWWAVSPAGSSPLAPVEHAAGQNERAPVVSQTPADEWSM